MFSSIPMPGPTVKSIAAPKAGPTSWPRLSPVAISRTALGRSRGPTMS